MRNRRRYIVAVSAVLGVAVLAAYARAQTRPEAVTYHEFTKTAGAPYGPFPTTWMVVTAANSLALAVVPSGYHQTVHHHDQEQFALGVEGELDYAIGGVVHRIGPNGASFPPSNVAHGMSNDSGEASLMLEFQPVRREDWLPPHPQVRQPQSSEPKALDAAQSVTLDYGLSSDGWRIDATGARAKILQLLGLVRRKRFGVSHGVVVDQRAVHLRAERRAQVESRLRATESRNESGDCRHARSRRRDAGVARQSRHRDCRVRTDSVELDESPSLSWFRRVYPTFPPGLRLSTAVASNA